ncbi:MAG: efflux RND transporter periplasmic adaptor subunit [Desulfovibrio sp.]|jgi:multidrug efflux system membrane fusion protein|nr:efflux RND transporter periplasmic adaptor subunit [Desulfovibrio sp.]
MLRIATCFLLFLPLLTACSGDGGKGGGKIPAPVHVVRVAKGDVPMLLHLVGNVKASATVGVKPRVTGEILKVHFEEGAFVREGDPLISIDPRPFEATLKERQGVLAKDQAQLNKADDDMRRYGKLVGGGYVSREAYDKTVTDRAALVATVQADKASVESAELDLSYCNITAPISGRVGALNVDKGNMVKTTDTTPIVTLDTLTPIYVNFAVPEAHLPVIQERMEAGEVPVSVRPTGGEEETGVLTLVDNAVDTRTGTIRLRATFANEHRRLWPGQFVEVTLPLGIAVDSLLVPTRAVQAGRDGTYVYCVNDKNEAVFKKVAVKFEYGGKSVVEGSLTLGEKVVEEGQVRLAPGYPVQIVEDRTEDGKKSKG